MKKKFRPWCLKLRGNNVPLAKYKSRTKTDGQWDTPRLICAFDWDRAIRFETKDDAWFYLNLLFEVYGKQTYKWFPMKVKTLVRRQNINPVYILRSKRMLARNFPKEEI